MQSCLGSLDQKEHDDVRDKLDEHDWAILLASCQPRSRPPGVLSLVTVVGSRVGGGLLIGGDPGGREESK